MLRLHNIKCDLSTLQAQNPAFGLEEQIQMMEVLMLLVSSS